MPSNVCGYRAFRCAKSVLGFALLALLGCASERVPERTAAAPVAWRLSAAGEGAACVAGGQAGACTACVAAISGKPRCAAARVDPNKLTLTNTVLAAQAGYYAKAAAGQQGVLNGTDLGWTFRHRDKLWIMYGDSWWLDPLNLVGVPDDSLAQISLQDFPDANSVEAFVRAHPAPTGQPAWRAAAPTMQVAVDPLAGFAAVRSERDGRPLRSGVGAVPIVAFSNGRDDAAEGVFSVFFDYEPVQCTRTGDCPAGYECDPGVGISSSGSLTPPCVVGAGTGCVRGPGLCQDRKSNRYSASSDMGRTTSVLLRHAVGATTSADPTHFKTQPWETLRFFNSTGRSVTDFDPSRSSAEANDYTPARGNALPRAGVFLWGRPHFAGIGSAGRDLRLYLLWAPMPTPDRELRFEWKPRYFSGLDAEQRPLFSDREIDAQALDLDAETAGEQPEELHDFVGQMNVSWVPSLQHFVMFYGGDSPGFSEGLLAWDDADKIQRDPLGRLWVRFAKQPWGPWTAPRPLMIAGDRRSDAEPTEQYAEGGILAHNQCRSASCARYDPVYELEVGSNNNGLLYGPSIIDAWTTAQAETTTLFWLLSTWNPYQVVLMKTLIRPE